MLACQFEVDLSCICGLGEVLAHQAGCEAWLGGGKTCVWGLEPGINDGNKSVPVKELYKGRECVHVVSAA